MAHGTPRINICKPCRKYLLVSRFTQNPICPICGKESEQTNKSKIKEEFQLSFLYDFKLSFTEWQEI